MTEQEMLDLHDKSFGGYDNILPDEPVGCFYCERTFNGRDVGFVTERPRSRKAWQKTAVCPTCGIDSIIPLTNVNVEDQWRVLEEMRRRWFGER